MRRIHSGTASFPDQIASSSFDGRPFQKLCRLCCLQNNFRSPRSHFCSSFLWRKIVKTIKSRESQKLVKLGGVVCLVTVHGYEKSKFSIDVAISKRSQLLEPLRQPFLTSFNIFTPPTYLPIYLPRYLPLCFELKLEFTGILNSSFYIWKR